LISGEVDKFKTFWCNFSAGLRIPKIVEIASTFDRVILKNKTLADFGTHCIFLFLVFHVSNERSTLLLGLENVVTLSYFCTLYIGPIFKQKTTVYGLFCDSYLKWGTISFLV